MFQGSNTEMHGFKKNTKEKTLARIILKYIRIEEKEFDLNLKKLLLINYTGKIFHIDMNIR